MTRQITAKFSSFCPNCRTQIEAGSQVLWEPGSKATHVECPKVQAPVAQAPRLTIEDAGVYVMPDGSVVKVQANQSKTRTYAKRWVEITGQRLTEADTRVQGEYQFEAGLVAEVAQVGRKMSLEEAKAFILRYGQCCRCSRKLKAADSVERGIGPVCIKYFSTGTTGADLLVSPVQEPQPERRMTGAQFAETIKTADYTMVTVVEQDDEARMRAIEFAEEPNRPARHLNIEEEEYAF